MAASNIPSRWLTPRVNFDSYVFRCSTDLNNLVMTNRAASYFRQLVDLLEKDEEVTNYHLKIRHNFHRNNQLDVIVYYNNPYRQTNPETKSSCFSCDVQHRLGVVTLLSEQQHTRAWLDGKGREKLILTPVRHVERLSELNDENGESAAFWSDAVDLIHRESVQGKDFYPSMVLNHGTYRNHAHLHLKITVEKDIWNEQIVPRYGQKLQQIQELMKEPEIAQDLFGRIPRHQRKEHGNKTKKGKSSRDIDLNQNVD